MGSSGWDPGLWWGPNSPGNSELVRLHSMSPCYSRYSNNKPHHKHNQREGDWCPGNTLGKCMSGSSPVSMKGCSHSGRWPNNWDSILGGYNKVVLTKNTETINAFSSCVITAKANTAHTSQRINVMTQALYVEDSPLLQGLMVQNAYAELRKRRKNVIMVVRNSTSYPQPLRKKTPVARAVEVTWVPEPLAHIGLTGVMWRGGG